MIVKEFRFLDANDPHDNTILNWSRCYEWPWVMEKLNSLPGILSIHNTCCGPGEIHKQFHDMLHKFSVDNSVRLINSDINETPVNSKFDNFKIYDVTGIDKSTHNVIICVSTLEEFASPEEQLGVIKNLFMQLRPGGRLLITCDFPGVKLAALEALLFQRCKGATTPLTGLSSIHKEWEYSGLNVIVLEIEKEYYV